jgi:hypothetical protein
MISKDNERITIVVPKVVRKWAMSHSNLINGKCSYSKFIREIVMEKFYSRHRKK